MFDTWSTGRGADSVHGFGLGRLQRDSKVVERRRADAGKTHPEGIHTQAEGHCKKQRRGELYAAALGASEAKGPEHDV